MATVSSQPRVGALLREWRERRRLTQLELALDAGISARHLSFVETGRSMPGREMLLRVAEQLEVPFRERNHLLLAAGHAPAFPSARSTTLRWRPSGRRSIGSSLRTSPIRLSSSTAPGIWLPPTRGSCR
jgi:transcriptional regulator with XRE-family HTH domain